MSPPNDKKGAKSKYQRELRESKTKLLSFGWFLRKSKSSRSSKDIVHTEKQMPSVPTSKSCDTGLTAFDAIDRYPKYLIWKLLPPAGRSTGQHQLDGKHSCRKLPFRSSFSCNDVHNLCPPLHFLPLNENNYTIASSRAKIGVSSIKQPCQSLYNLYKSQSALGNHEKSLINSEEVSENPTRNILCKLCLGMVPINTMHTLQDCNCAFCIPCLHQYITINIRDSNIPLTCPDAGCSESGKILSSEIEEIAGEEALSMFERYKFNLDVEKDPSKLWCPAPGCETVCSFQPSTNPDACAPVYCFTCRLKFCSICKLRWHGKGNCNDAKDIYSDDTDLSGSDDESWIKHCPNCRIPIEKDEGCAQMMCYRCKHVFCWNCLASLDDDFLLRHYDKGPCRNKLGHSRASMIWHRTQVIGIFAGFSFLLLMASPFLLLASPCLLCCRCKNKFLYEEATEL